MKWVKAFRQWPWAKNTWNLEDGPVQASVTQREDDSTFAAAVWLGDNQAEQTFDTVERAFEWVRQQALHHLVILARQLRETAIPVENELGPVEVIPNSQHKAGYGDGWLLLRAGRAIPPGDRHQLDDGRLANVHPFIAPDAKLAEELGVPLTARVAGIRWFD